MPLGSGGLEAFFWRPLPRTLMGVSSIVAARGEGALFMERCRITQDDDDSNDW
jgi:hypothetical protein